MSENNIQTLRDALFETIKALKDPDNPMDIARAKAISNAAQVLVNSVKVEIEVMKVGGGRGTGFVPELGDHSEEGKGNGNAKIKTVRLRNNWQ